MRRIAGVNAGLIPSNSGVYKHEGDHQGIDLHIHDGTVVGIWFTHDDKGRRYYIFTGSTTDKEFPLFTTYGGTFTDSSKQTEEQVGICKLDLMNGVFHYNDRDHGRDSVDIQRIAHSTHPHNGIYAIDGKRGSGVSIREYPENETISIYVYTYNRLEKQEWMLFSGNKDDIKTYRCAEGKFRYIGAEEIEMGDAWLAGDELHYDIKVPNLTDVPDRVIGVFKLKRSF